jgi:acetyl esterase/lipase
MKPAMPAVTHRRAILRFASILVAGMLLAGLYPALAVAGGGPAAGGRGGTEYSTFEYTTFDGKPLELDVYRPNNTDQSAPAVIFVHGGGFRSGNKTQGRKFAVEASSRGLVGISIDYRLTETPGHPGEVDDVLAAVAWVRENAESLGVDPARIALYGTSAGGTLASLAGVMPAGPLDGGERVVAVVSFSGVKDFTTL